MSAQFDTSVFRQPRWISAFLVGVLIAIACVRLGFWQLDRLDERRERNAQIEARLEQPARPIASLRGEYHDDPEELAYRHAIAEGTYRSEDEFISVGRIYGDVKGALVATPLELSDGSVLIVVRGIVPGDSVGPPLVGYETPITPVVIEGRLSAGEEPSRITEPDPVDGDLTSLSRLDLEFIDEWVEGDVLPFSILLDEQTPAGPGEQPTPIPNEELTEGSHLGYAVQWFAFAIIAFAGAVGLMWRAGRQTEDAEVSDTV